MTTLHGAIPTLRFGATPTLRYSAFPTPTGGGNPAGVVLDASALTDADMLGLAAELGCSETAFLEPRADREYRVRYFSPQAEVDFCGHATVAAAVTLADAALGAGGCCSIPTSGRSA